MECVGRESGPQGSTSNASPIPKGVAMRSVNVHLVGASRDEVAEQLSTIAQKGMGDHWYHPDRQHTRCTIRFHPGAHQPQPPNTADEFVGTLGASPDLTLYVDTGSRLNPDEAGKQIAAHELHDLVEKLLARFRGVARDDLTNHLWTLEEIRSKKSIHGATFGDHEAWRRSHKKTSQEH